MLIIKFKVKMKKNQDDLLFDMMKRREERHFRIEKPLLFQVKDHALHALLLEELEELLITADIGVETTLFLIQALQEKLRRRELGEVERLKAALKAEMVALLTAPPPPDTSSRPSVE